MQQQEQQSMPNESANIATINTTLVFIQRDIAQINTRLENGVTTKTTFDDFSSMVNRRLKNLETATQILRYLIPVVYTVLGSILTFLFINYLQHIGK